MFFCAVFVGISKRWFAFKRNRAYGLKDSRLTDLGGLRLLGRQCAWLEKNERSSKG